MSSVPRCRFCASPLEVYDGRPYCPECTSFTLPDADRAEYEAFAATPDGQLEYIRWRIAVLREAEADLEIDR